MKLKSILSILLSMLVFSATIPGACAADKSDKEYDQIGQYKLEVINGKDLPDGVVPLKFNTKEEAEIYLDTLEKEANEINQASKLATGNNAKGNGSSVQNIMALKTYNGSSYKDFSQCGGLHYVRVHCYYTYYTLYGGKYYTACNNVTSSNCGYTLDSRWTQNYYTASLIDANRCIAVNVYGTMKHYLLVNGVIEMTSRDLQFYAEF